VITHVVSFRWKPETAPANIAEIRDGLASLPAAVPSIRTYTFGSDVGLSGPVNMDFVIVATFDSVDGWREYDQHPVHEQVRAEIIRPWIAERAVVQFES
jgi:hypothetical protein